MLLSSSLTIETIRIYARKLKQLSHRDNNEDGWSLAFSDASFREQRRWRLSRLLTAAKGQTLVKNRFPMLRQASAGPHYTAPGPPAPPTPNWTPIKNIFPACSDYLCDALYAHLVAFNYVSTLCPRGPGPHASPLRPCTREGGREEDSLEIPRKAATILGLSPGFVPDAVCRPQGAVRGPKANRKSLSHGWVPETARYSVAARTVSADSSMRELQEGLAKCIARLVATMKLTGNDCGNAPRGAEDAREIDPLFVRSLCEVVRCCENA
jgi:hypothetical protein